MVIALPLRLLDGGPILNPSSTVDATAWQGNWEHILGALWRCRGRGVDTRHLSVFCAMVVVFSSADFISLGESSGQALVRGDCGVELGLEFESASAGTVTGNGGADPTHSVVVPTSSFCLGQHVKMTAPRFQSHSSSLASSIAYQR
jgi:hypothetical protein